MSVCPCGGFIGFQCEGFIGLMRQRGGVGGSRICEEFMCQVNMNAHHRATATETATETAHLNNNTYSLYTRSGRLVMFGGRFPLALYFFHSSLLFKLSARTKVRASVKERCGTSGCPSPASFFEVIFPRGPPPLRFPPLEPPIFVFFARGADASPSPPRAVPALIRAMTRALPLALPLALPPAPPPVPPARLARMGGGRLPKEAAAAAEEDEEEEDEEEDAEEEDTEAKEDDEEGATAFRLPRPAALTTAAGTPSRSPACGSPTG